MHRNAAGSRLSERRCPGIVLAESTGRGAGDSANQRRVLRVDPGHTCVYRPSLVPRLLPGSGTSLPSGTRVPGYTAWLHRATKAAPRSVRAAPENWQLAAAKLRHGGYVTFHRGHCGCQEEQQQAIQGHRRPASPRLSPSRDAPRPGAPLRSRRVASPCPFSLWPGPDSPERGVGVGGSVRAWGGAGARGCGCACVCVCLWERWVCACVCERG